MEMNFSLWPNCPASKKTRSIGRKLIGMTTIRFSKLQHLSHPVNSFETMLKYRRNFCFSLNFEWNTAFRSFQIFVQELFMVYFFILSKVQRCLNANHGIAGLLNDEILQFFHSVISLFVFLVGPKIFLDRVLLLGPTVFVCLFVLFRALLQLKKINSW